VRRRTVFKDAIQGLESVARESYLFNLCLISVAKKKLKLPRAHLPEWSISRRVYAIFIHRKRKKDFLLQIMHF